MVTLEDRREGIMASHFAEIRFHSQTKACVTDLGSGLAYAALLIRAESFTQPLLTEILR